MFRGITILKNADQLIRKAIGLGDLHSDIRVREAERSFFYLDQGQLFTLGR